MLNISQSHKRSLTLQQQAPPALKYDGWRIFHDAEMPMAWRLERYGEALRNRLPEVYVLSETVVYMTEPIQHLTKDINPAMTSAKWRSLYAWNRAFSNGSGFNGEVPCADLVNYLDVNAELPAFDKVRICGGAFVTGHISGNYLIVDTLNPANIPTPAELLAQPQYFFHAVSTNNDTGISKFPQGDGLPVYVPLFAKAEARIPLNQVERWQSNSLPDPYKLYHPAAV